MLKNNKFSIWVALMLAVILMGAFHPARALAQCGGGDHQGMHEQHMGSSGQMGMGPGNGHGPGAMGMSGQSGQMGMGSGQMGMTNPQDPGQADLNAVAPSYVAPGSIAPQATGGSGRMTGMDYRGHQH